MLSLESDRTTWKGARSSREHRAEAAQGRQEVEKLKQNEMQPHGYIPSDLSPPGKPGLLKFLRTYQACATSWGPEPFREALHMQTKALPTFQ